MPAKPTPRKFSSKKFHDATLRRLLVHAQWATELLRAGLAVRLGAPLPAGLFRHAPTGHADDASERGFLDGLFMLPLPGGRHLLVPVEGKSTPEPKTPEQLARYLRLVREWYRRHYPKHPEPVILPLVVYNGEAKWRVPHAVSAPERIARMVRKLLNGLDGAPVLLGYALLDLTHRDWDWQALAPTPEVRAVLMALAWQSCDGEDALCRICAATQPGSDLEVYLCNSRVSQRFLQ